MNRVIAFILVFIITGIGCQSSEDRTTRPDAEANETTGGEEPANEAVVKVVLREFEIDVPDSVPFGPKTLIVKNNGTMMHSFRMQGPGFEMELDAHLRPAESKNIDIDLQPGVYTIYCPIGEHKARGMKAKITAIE